MKRIEIQLTDEKHEQLRTLAHNMHSSIRGVTATLVQGLLDGSIELATSTITREETVLTVASNGHRKGGRSRSRG